MFSTTSLLVLLVVVASAALGDARHVQIYIRDNVTQSCPNVRSDVIDQHSVRLSFDMLPSSGGSGRDQVTVITRDGEARTVNFPGCYQIKLSFRMKKVIVNPYIEAFLQMGTNLPCQTEDNNEDNGPLSHICGNVTKTNWCPQSQNARLRSQLNMKSTCRFCNLCQTAQAEGTEARKYITLDNPNQECRTDQDIQTFSFKMCTPDKKDIRKANAENEGKIEEYWNYLKQGVLTAVVHVMDRGAVSENTKNQCARMCSILEGQAVSESYRTTLLETIQSRCVPQDTYAACVYHTLKFDVNGDH